MIPLIELENVTVRRDERVALEAVKVMKGLDETKRERMFDILLNPTE